jgi:flagellin-specific chaperone FliS
LSGRNNRTVPVDDAAGTYFKTMVTTSGGLDLFRFLYDRAIRNLRRIESILEGERDPGQMPTLYKKTADILNYLLLLYQEQYAEEDPDAAWFVQLHEDLLESITDFAWDMDRERVLFCREVLTHVRKQLGHPQVRLPRHEAVLEAMQQPAEMAPTRMVEAPVVSGVRSAAMAVEGKKG